MGEERRGEERKEKGGARDFSTPADSLFESSPPHLCPLEKLQNDDIRGHLVAQQILGGRVALFPSFPPPAQLLSRPPVGARSSPVPPPPSPHSSLLEGSRSPHTAFGQVFSCPDVVSSHCHLFVLEEGPVMACSQDRALVAGASGRLPKSRWFRHPMLRVMEHLFSPSIQPLPFSAAFSPHGPSAPGGRGFAASFSGKRVGHLVARRPLCGPGPGGWWGCIFPRSRPANSMPRTLSMAARDAFGTGGELRDGVALA